MSPIRDRVRVGVRVRGSKKDRFSRGNGECGPPSKPRMHEAVAASQFKQVSRSSGRYCVLFKRRGVGPARVGGGAA